MDANRSEGRKVNFLPDGKVTLVDSMGSDLTVVNAARVSFNKHVDTVGESDRGLIRFLIEMGVAKEVARAVLPLGTFTQFFWSVNLRSLFNFLSLRNAPQAQREIRVLAQQVEDIVSAHMPETMGTWRTAGGTAV